MTAAAVTGVYRVKEAVERRKARGLPPAHSPFVEAALGYDHLEAGALARKPKPAAAAAQEPMLHEVAGPASCNALSPARPASRAELMDPEFWREQREKEDL